MSGRLQAPGPRLRPVVSAGTATCPRCDHRLPRPRWEQALRVCPQCGHHAHVPAWVRAAQLADVASLEPLQPAVEPVDPLHFDDGVPYVERLARAREHAGTDEALILARARVEGVPALLICMEFGFLGGSLGAAAGELFSRGCTVAAAERRGLVVVCSSGGARMQEGIVALAQMATCTAAVARVVDTGLPYISVLADPCFGGVTASFATQADAVLAEPGARIGFAGGRVIEQATRERLPEGFQTAEFLLAHGMVDAVVPRQALRETVGRLLDLLGTRIDRERSG